MSPRRRTGPNPEVRQAVVDRDKHRCARCGRQLPGYPASIHHRTPRGMGGTRDPKVNKASNLLLLCGTGTTGCHGWVESHRKEATERGFLVPWWQDPAEVPVNYWDGKRYLGD